MATEGATNTGIHGQGGATILFNNAREAVKHGDVVYVRGYIMSVAGAVMNAGSDGKTLLHSAALSGQTSIIAELLLAGANPHARCSSGETPLDLAKRNGHNDALSCLLRHAPLSAPPQFMRNAANDPGRDPPGATLAVTTATGAASSALPGKGSRGFFRSWRREGPKGADGGNLNEDGGTTPATKTKKGRGKRPVLLRASGGACETPHGGGGGAHDGGVDVGGGWVLYTDAEGFQYCWNETLNESSSSAHHSQRWVDQSTALPVAPAPSPDYHMNASSFSHASGSVGGGGVGGSSITCVPSPAYSNPPGHSWANSIYGYGNNPPSPVHSPGWPSLRAAEGGMMQLPLPPTPTNDHAPGAAAHGAGFATMPPSPPSPSDVRADAVGVAWLAETETPKAAKATTGAGESTTGAAAAAAAGGQAGCSAVAGGGTANVANSAFYGQEHPLSPATRGRLWAERVKADEGASETHGVGAPPDTAKSRGWMKNFRHRDEAKEKGGKTAASERSRSTGDRESGTFVEPGHDGDDVSTLTEATGEGDRRDGSSHSGSETSTSSSSSSSSSSSGSSSSTGTCDDRSSTTDSSDSSSDSSDSSTATGSSIDSATVDPTAGRTTIGESFVPPPTEPVTPMATDEAAVALTTAGASGGENSLSLPPRTWCAQQPTVVGVPPGYAYPVAAARPVGEGYDGVAQTGWADLEPQPLPPYAPTALWRQEEAPTAYHGAAEPLETDRTYGRELDEQQQQQQQLPGETDNLITLSSSSTPPSTNI